MKFSPQFPTISFQTPSRSTSGISPSEITSWRSTILLSHQAVLQPVNTFNLVIVLMIMKNTRAPLDISTRQPRKSCPTLNFISNAPARGFIWSISIWLSKSYNMSSKESLMSQKYANEQKSSFCGALGFFFVFFVRHRFNFLRCFSFPSLTIECSYAFSYVQYIFE
jgi:hypothetical protein